MKEFTEKTYLSNAFDIPNFSLDSSISGIKSHSSLIQYSFDAAPMSGRKKACDVPKFGGDHS